MRKVLSAVLACSVVAIVAAGLRAEDKPKVAIKDVMTKAMKGGLCKKCASGQASDDEKKELVSLFESLCANEPPKGEKDAWKKKTDALLTAAKAVAAGEKDASKKLGAAANCMACHKEHKP